MMEEVVLAGGVANAGKVVRVGDHVLRPSSAQTPAIHGLLRALHVAGFTAVPSPVGVDPDGRERLGFIAGDVPITPYPAWAQTDEALGSIAELMARFHQVAARIGVIDADWNLEMADPEGGPIVCHNDVCMENVVFDDGKAIALLDFEFGAPGRPIYDLGQFARLCVPILDDASSAAHGWHVANRPARLRVVADSYRLDAAGRAELLEVLDAGVARVGEFVWRRVEAGDPNFIAMWEGMGGRERFDRIRRWWRTERAHFAEALR